MIVQPNRPSPPSHYTTCLLYTSLDKDAEPDIYNAIKRNALLENVTLDENGKIDFADKSVTENTRVSYPIDHIEKIVRPVSTAPAAKNVIFLSADAFGVLPPVSILTAEQTEYYFLSGFTAKLAGTERGITEPTPPFSACFGQAFLCLLYTSRPSSLNSEKPIGRRVSRISPTLRKPGFSIALEMCIRDRDGAG